ncbi:hypothetical protein JG687_00019075, partial [Phytophthora cactorum]
EERGFRQPPLQERHPHGAHVQFLRQSSETEVASRLQKLDHAPARLPQWLRNRCRRVRQKELPPT